MFVLIIIYAANLRIAIGFLFIRKVQKVLVKVQFDWYFFGVTSIQHKKQEYAFVKVQFNACPYTICLFVDPRKRSSLRFVSLDRKWP